jgi:predicted GNAT superfamily acetyltransferase
MPIQYRPIIAPEEMETVADLHKLVWTSDDRDIVPGHILVAIQHAGGLILGAFDGKQLVGFSVAFLGRHGVQWLLWSHETGIHPDYQGRGIGARLKWLQREHALADGLNCIAWTFDPLQAGNAKFNIHYLGCTCNIYHENVYGAMHDRLNAGLPSDRFETRWWLVHKHVTTRMKQPPKLEAIDAIHRSLISVEGSPQIEAGPTNQRRTLVEIPSDLSHLKHTQPQMALAWRLATREVFNRLFGMGYTIVGFQHHRSGHPCYILGLGV